MARYRKIHLDIWTDGWFLELSPDEKLLYIYLFSNARTSISGLYEISPRLIQFETGLDKSTIDTTIARFMTEGKVDYEDGVIWVRNLRKYYENPSIKVRKAMWADISRVVESSVKNRYMAYYQDLDPNGSRDDVSAEIESGRDRAPGPVSWTHHSLDDDDPAYGDDIVGDVDEMVGALAGVVKETLAIGVNEAKFRRVAEALLRDDRTPDEVEAFGRFWREKGWYEGRPALSAVLNEIKNTDRPEHRDHIDSILGMIESQYDDPGR